MIGAMRRPEAITSHGTSWTVVPVPNQTTDGCRSVTAAERTFRAGAYSATEAFPRSSARIAHRDQRSADCRRATVGMNHRLNASDPQPIDPRWSDRVDSAGTPVLDP